MFQSSLSTHLKAPIQVPMLPSSGYTRKQITTQIFGDEKSKYHVSGLFWTVVDRGLRFYTY